MKTSTGDSFKSRCDLLNIEDDLRVNLLAFDVGIPEGFLPTRDESHKTTSAVLSVGVKTIEEALAINDEGVQHLVIDGASDDVQATHVVIGIEWGANALAKIRTTHANVETAKSASAKLKRAIAGLGAKLTNSLNTGSPADEKRDDFFENYKFEFYGNVTPVGDEPGSIEEIMQYLHEVNSCFGFLLYGGKHIMQCLLGSTLMSNKKQRKRIPVSLHIAPNKSVSR